MLEKKKVVIMENVTTGNQIKLLATKLRRERKKKRL